MEVLDLFELGALLLQLLQVLPSAPLPHTNTAGEALANHRGV